MSVRLSVRLSRIIPDVNAVDRLIWRILDVSHRRAAAASVLRCDPKDEDRYRLVFKFPSVDGFGVGSGN